MNPVLSVVVALTSWLVIAYTLIYVFSLTMSGLQVVRRSGLRLRDQERIVVPAGSGGLTRHTPTYHVFYLIPCLNEEAVIDTTIDRLLHTQEPGTIVVIDDGSTDRTAELAERHAGEDVVVIRRVWPDARRGKGEALNCAFRRVLQLVAERDYDPRHCLVCVMDADGQLSPGASTAVAEVFAADESVGGVQLVVRIRNRGSLITRFQDMEFWAMSGLGQLGRIATGTVSMGGKGQFTRLHALTELGTDPWSHSLTEDLDLGVRLVINGWKTSSTALAYVSQQAVESLRALVRQRTRWYQGAPDADPQPACPAAQPAGEQPGGRRAGGLSAGALAGHPAVVSGAAGGAGAAAQRRGDPGLPGGRRPVVDPSPTGQCVVRGVVLPAPVLGTALLAAHHSRFVGQGTADGTPDGALVLSVLPGRLASPGTDDRPPRYVGQDREAGRDMRVLARELLADTGAPGHCGDRTAARATTEVLCLYGTRPEAIKQAPVVRALRASPGHVVHPVSTGQHRHLLTELERHFALDPEAVLECATSDGSLNGLAAAVLVQLDPLLRSRRPDLIIVQGDTTTALAGTLAGFHLQLPVAHLEAGLRTGSLASPFPEEGNRRLISQLATLHLAPTLEARRNLQAEGIDPDSIMVTGNTVIDALHQTLALPSRPHPVIDALGRRPYVLVTTHRRENWGAPLERISAAIAQLADTHRDHDFVLPVHANPTVAGPVHAALDGIANVVLLEPLGYDHFCRAMAGARLVLTDSGGVQEEAPSLGVPVLVMRDTTERPEGILAGTVTLVGTHTEQIVRQVHILLTDPDAHRRMAEAVNPYGDGRAAVRVVAAIDAWRRGRSLPADHLAGPALPVQHDDGPPPGPGDQ